MPCECRHGTALSIHLMQRISKMNVQSNLCGEVWLAEWCKIHKVYIHSHSMLFLVFTNIFIHIQQLSFYSRNIFIYI